MLPEVPTLKELSPSVYVVLGMNPSPFALTGTNTYLVGTGAKRILIDTGEGVEAYIPNLTRALAAVGATGLQEIIVTHWHHDHLGGVPSVIKHFGEVPVRKFMPAVQEDTFGGEGALDPYAIWPADRFKPLEDGEVVHTEGAGLRVLYTPGHANDHVVLLHEEEQAMFTGDNVLGVGTAVFRDLAVYMDSLDKMESAVLNGGIATLYPAHGPTIANASTKLNEYKSHRQQRIDQVQLVMKSAGSEGMTCEEITRSMYKEIPERLMPAAAGNTVQVLLKLQRDNVAVRLSASKATSHLQAIGSADRWVLKSSKM